MACGHPGNGLHAFRSRRRDRPHRSRGAAYGPDRPSRQGQRKRRAASGSHSRIIPRCVTCTNRRKRWTWASAWSSFPGASMMTTTTRRICSVTHEAANRAEPYARSPDGLDAASRAKHTHSLRDDRARSPHQRQPMQPRHSAPDHEDHELRIHLLAHRHEKFVAALMRHLH